MRLLDFTHVGRSHLDEMRCAGARKNRRRSSNYDEDFSGRSTSRSPNENVLLTLGTLLVEQCNHRRESD